jgi:hypothetical protein
MSFRAGARAVVSGAALVFVLLLVAAAPARAQILPTDDWSWMRPGVAWQYIPSSADECISGRSTCVHRTLRTMNQQFSAAAARCEHDAVFSLAYLRTTEEFKRAVETPGFFEDFRYLNHEDAVFAELYFDARTDWDAGRKSAVPGAWALAFDAADRKAVSGMGNLLLGMNAHVQLDLPKTLAAIGLVKPDGGSRKADHDKVNVFLNRIAQPIITEIAQRFDPSVSYANLPGPFDEYTFFQLLVAWRETAWRNAERLVAASGSAARLAVAKSIGDYAASQAALIRSATRYLLPAQGTATRDAYCDAHN